MDEETYTLKQASKRLGIPVYTVRRFCNAGGVVLGVRRKSNGYRILSQEQVDLVGTFAQMMRAGFTMVEIKKYAKLQRAGKKTLLERKGMLTTKQHQLRQQIRDLQEYADFLELMTEALDR